MWLFRHVRQDHALPPWPELREHPAEAHLCWRHTRGRSDRGGAFRWAADWSSGYSQAFLIGCLSCQSLFTVCTCIKLLYIYIYNNFRLNNHKIHKKQRAVCYCSCDLLYIVIYINLHIQVIFKSIHLVITRRINKLRFNRISFVYSEKTYYNSVYIYIYI